MSALIISLLASFGILCVIALTLLAEKNRNGCTFVVAAMLLFWLATAYYVFKYLTH